MAKKTILGIDIGHDQLKMALVRNGQVLQTASASMPENLMKEGRVTSRETMADLIKRTLRDNHIRASLAAFVLPNETVYVKNVDMPMMTVDQLVYNLPFEFNDYITGEVKDYVFDYAVLPKPEESDVTFVENGETAAPPEEKTKTLELMAVGTLRAVVEDAQEILHKASLKMVKAAPALCSYISLIRAKKDELAQVADEFGILDLGYQAVRMYMYRGDRHVATRVLEVGLSTIDDVLSDTYGVDIHLAHTYLMSNFEDCQNREECVTAYENIAVELMRALNFYRFSNPDSDLSDLWLCGGGAVIRPLTDMIGEMLDIRLHQAEELVNGGESIQECNSFVQAIGVTLD